MLGIERTQRLANSLNQWYRTSDNELTTLLNNMALTISELSNIVADLNNRIIELENNKK